MTCIHPLIPTTDVHSSLRSYLDLCVFVFNYRCVLLVWRLLQLWQWTNTSQTDPVVLRDRWRRGRVVSTCVEKYVLLERMSGQVDWGLEISCQTQDLCSRVWKVPVCLPAPHSTSFTPPFFFSASFCLDGIDVSRWWPISPTMLPSAITQGTKTKENVKGTWANEISLSSKTPFHSDSVPSTNARHTSLQMNYVTMRFNVSNITLLKQYSTKGEGCHGRNINQKVHRNYSNLCKQLEHVVKYVKTYIRFFVLISPLMMTQNLCKSCNFDSILTK